MATQTDWERMGTAKAALATLVVAICGACSYLPEAGPSRFAIDRNASESLLLDKRAVVTDYVLLDISQNVLSHVLDIGPESFFRSFGGGKGPAPNIRIGVGDALQVSIFEASVGGLFSSGEIGTRPGNFTTLPLQTVDHRGNITVPYAGQINVVGQTVVDVQNKIEARLAQRAIEPQVVVSLPEQSSAEISVFGDATGNFRARVRSGGERVLDMIARAGVRFPGHEVFVTLQRGERRATIHFPRLIDKPDENIFVRPGDVLYVNRNQQRFTVLGATGQLTQTQGLNGQFAFETPELSLTEAVARAGGLLDSRANARSVFLYRLEYRESLERMGVLLTQFPPEQTLIPTIYRANFVDPSVFFTATQFPMRHRDIIYVANANSVELEKFLNHLRLVTGTVAGVTGDVLSTRNSVRALGQ